MPRSPGCWVFENQRALSKRCKITSLRFSIELAACTPMQMPGPSGHARKSRAGIVNATRSSAQPLQRWLPYDLPCQTGMIAAFYHHQERAKAPSHQQQPLTNGSSMTLSCCGKTRVMILSSPRFKPPPWHHPGQPFQPWIPRPKLSSGPVSSFRTGCCISATKLPGISTTSWNCWCLPHRVPESFKRSKWGWATLASSRHSIGSSPGSTCRAYFTKWPEVYAVLDQRAASTAEHLLNEMFYSFAVPEELHGTQGRNFEVSVFSEVCRRPRDYRDSDYATASPEWWALWKAFTELWRDWDQKRDWDLHLPLVVPNSSSGIHKVHPCSPHVRKTAAYPSIFSVWGVSGAGATGLSAPGLPWKRGGGYWDWGHCTHPCALPTTAWGALRALTATASTPGTPQRPFVAGMGG